MKVFVVVQCVGSSLVEASVAESRKGLVSWETSAHSLPHAAECLASLAP